MDKDLLLESFLKIVEEKYPDYTDEQLVSEVDKLLDTKLDDFTEITLKSFKDEYKSTVKDILDYENDFNSRLNQRWNVPFTSLTYFIHRILTEGDNFNKIYRSSAINSSEYKILALIHIHGKSCLISKEILCLLKGGFPEAANARWRTLYENSLNAMYISKYDDTTAKRYLDFSIIEEYHRSSDDLKLELEDKIDKLKDLYGEKFISKRGGWYAHNEPKSQNRGSKYLEKEVNVEHMNYWHKLACVNVHAGSDSLTSKLGLMKHLENKIILAGPTNYGLSIPAQLTTISLSQITMVLLLSKPKIENIILSNAIVSFGKEVSNDFVECQLKLEEDEIELQRNDCSTSQLNQ